MRDDRLITLASFLDSFARQHADRPDRPFCFILGAGASVSSGIPDAGEMVREWLEWMHRADDFEGLPLDRWATPANLGIEGFEWARAEEFYPQVYLRCYREREDDGHAHLEKRLAGREPGLGYASLAGILAHSPHRIVVTTNFDDLAAEAIAFHAQTFPTVVTLEALGEYARIALKRPLVAKVHGNLGFQRTPNGEASTAARQSLEALLHRYTPVVIGYAGHDGTLLEHLEALATRTSGTVFWCIHDPALQPTAALAAVPPRIRALIHAWKGRFVPVPGFDELMVLLHHRLAEAGQLAAPTARLRDRLGQRCQRLAELRTTFVARHRSLPSALDSSPPTGLPPSDPASLLAAAVASLDADDSSAPPDSGAPDLSSASADRCETEALRLAADGRTEEAEAWFRRTLDARPDDADTLGNYALFLAQRGRETDAGRWFQRALAAAPRHPNNLGNYAVLLKNLGHTSRAESLYRRALEANPRHAGHLGNYAVFLAQHGRLDEADSLFRRACEADPRDAVNLGNFARHLASRDRLEEALPWALHAVDSDSAHPTNVATLVQLLFACGRTAEAVTRLERSAAAEARHPDLGLELGFYRLTHLPDSWDAHLPQVRSLLDAGFRLPDWNPGPSLRWARQALHPRLAFLETLAAIMAGEAEPDQLD